jgi:hypothetical protein
VAGISANTTRFVSEDRIGYDGGDVNLYRYERNNPVNAVDPSGQYIVAANAAAANDWVKRFKDSYQIKVTQVPLKSGLIYLQVATADYGKVAGLATNPGGIWGDALAKAASSGYYNLQVFSGGGVLWTRDTADRMCVQVSHQAVSVSREDMEQIGALRRKVEPMSGVVITHKEGARSYNVAEGAVKGRIIADNRSEAYGAPTGQGFGRTGGGSKEGVFVGFQGTADGEVQFVQFFLCRLTAIRKPTENKIGGRRPVGGRNPDEVIDIPTVTEIGVVRSGGKVWRIDTKDKPKTYPIYSGVTGKERGLEYIWDRPDAGIAIIRNAIKLYKEQKLEWTKGPEILEFDCEITFVTYIVSKQKRILGAVGWTASNSAGKGPLGWDWRERLSTAWTGSKLICTRSGGRKSRSFSRRSSRAIRY